MAEYQVIASTDITLVEFDDEQKAKVAAALQALVDQRWNTDGNSKDQEHDKGNNKLNDQVVTADTRNHTNELQLLVKDPVSKLKESEKAKQNKRPIVINEIFTKVNCKQIKIHSCNVDCESFSIINEESNLSTAAIGDRLQVGSYKGTQFFALQSDVMKKDEKVEPPQLCCDVQLNKYKLSKENKICNNITQITKETIIRLDANEEYDSDTDLVYHTENTFPSAVSGSNGIFRTSAANLLECLYHCYCPQCGINCGTHFKWTLHMKSEHKFDTAEGLNLFTFKINDKCYYRCRDCSKQLKAHLNFNELWSHRLTHLPFPKYLKCQFCNDVYLGSNAAAIAHRVIEHSQFSKGFENNLFMQYIKIYCPFCSKIQKNLYEYHKHINGKHDFTDRYILQMSMEPKVNNGKQLYRCDECPAIINKVASLKEHLLAHEVHKSFACTLCNTYASRLLAGIKNHVWRKHVRKGNCMAGETLKRCIYCVAVFENEEQRHLHHSTEHK